MAAGANGDVSLELLNERLAGSHEARGVRGGLGRVKGPRPFASAETPKGPRWAPAGQDPLYRRFTRGPVLGGSCGNDEAPGSLDVDAATWRSHIEAALRDAGGALTWPELREEVVTRWRREHGNKCSGDESQLQNLALAHIPEDFLSQEPALDNFQRPRQGQHPLARLQARVEDVPRAGSPSSTRG